MNTDIDTPAGHWTKEDWYQIDILPMLGDFADDYDHDGLREALVDAGHATMVQTSTMTLWVSADIEMDWDLVARYETVVAS